MLFVRPGTPPSLDELLAQARKMFVDFHSHIKRMEILRTCKCGACSSVHCLSLKFVAHFGPARIMQVKGHSKFIGKSIIVAHRLLKNQVPVEPQAFMTRDACSLIEQRNPERERISGGGLPAMR